MINFIKDKAESGIINSLKSLWPFEISVESDSIDIELGNYNKEIWAFPLSAGSDFIDDAIHAMEEHRKVIPAALNRCIDKIDGIFFVGYYAKKLKENEYEHGLVIIPANRGSKNLNSELLTSYCFERNNLYENMLSQEYFSQINFFLNSYKSVCKKYWIQDTKLINTSFVNRPTIKDDDSFIEQAAASTWHTEIYPDFMRPVSMIGDIFIDFMICSHKLIFLHNEIEEDDSIWDFFEEEGIKHLYTLPAYFKNNSLPNTLKGWCETTSFELSERRDLDFKTIYDIAVPGLKGTVVNQGYSIGWCGKIAFICIGIDKPLYISPDFVKQLSDIVDFEQAGFDNKALWRNRDIEYRKKIGNHNLVKVCDDLMTELRAKEKLFEACEIVLQTCKNPLKEVQKGITKFILRYLKGLARGTYEKEASYFINEINSAKICENLKDCIYKINRFIKESLKK